VSVPVAITRNCAVHSPASVRTRQRAAASSNVAPWDPRAEAQVASEVEAVGDAPGVGEELGLRGVALAPTPLLLEIGVERERVLQALDVATRARVAVPVPGAAHVGGTVEHDRRAPEPAEPVEHVQAAEPGAHDDRIHLVRHARAAYASRP
jgi:hypothetical protein